MKGYQIGDNIVTTCPLSPFDRYGKIIGMNKVAYNVQLFHTVVDTIDTYDDVLGHHIVDRYSINGLSGVVVSIVKRNCYSDPFIDEIVQRGHTETFGWR